VIFGVAVVFPIVITFGVAGVLTARHAQGIVQGFFPWSSPSAFAFPNVASNSNNNNNNNNNKTWI